ncbi:hypothetical protein AWH62_06550 [Maricaulis sp. W15]|uniref:eCIS core domain-containing protein n=1 Tax=Maricaulis sp. W15 TaxID=1772333 RepID=UPI0009491D3D|nr:DUF4157 domain-containing protein [Maricaulis sp. W15]OLF75471.1 hypothetical protein AWH62_06550 [Maricaulis sp. W15]
MLRFLTVSIVLGIALTGTALSQDDDGGGEDGETGGGGPAGDNGGQPIDPLIRDRFEPDDSTNIFADVRAHDGDSSTHDTDARAFTHGSNLTLGERDPNSPASRGMMAHELSHTLQQSMGDPQSSSDSATDDGSDEDGERDDKPADERPEPVRRGDRPERGERPH